MLLHRPDNFKDLGRLPVIGSCFCANLKETRGTELKVRARSSNHFDHMTQDGFEPSRKAVKRSCVNVFHSCGNVG